MRPGRRGSDQTHVEPCGSRPRRTLMRDSSVVMGLRELIKPKCKDFDAVLPPMNSSWTSVPTIRHGAGVPKPSNRPWARATVNSWTPRRESLRLCHSALCPRKRVSSTIFLTALVQLSGDRTDGLVHFGG